MAKDDSGFAEIEEYTRKLTQNPESSGFCFLGRGLPEKRYARRGH
jgi:hypothetical protein